MNITLHKYAGTVYFLLLLSKETYQTTISANFNPEDFDAKKVVAAVKKAGMKYLVITAKHHEGLAMWDTEVDSFYYINGGTYQYLQGFLLKSFLQGIALSDTWIRN